MCFVPRLPTSAHRFDWLGVLLSAAGMFMLVFGIQEGSSYDWGVIWGPITVWGLIIAGAVVLVLFVVWQRVQRGEPLIPLRIFRDRNFSVGTAVIVTVGLGVTSMGLPLMFYLQLVLGLAPTQAALMMVPMAVLSIALARPVGLLIDRRDPRRIPVLGLLLVASGLLLYFLLAGPDTPIWLLLIPSAVLGLGNAFMWGPLASLTTFGLSPEYAGAGSGVYNTSRQVGAVMGSAAMAALMESRISAQLGAAAGDLGSFSGEAGSGVSALPEPLREGFAAAMAQSILMPLAVILVGAVIALCFGPRPARTGGVRLPVEG
jgi:Na+/melibiose symporter-like transporter